MIARALVCSILILSSVASPLVGQGIRDRLKKAGVTVTTGKKDSAKTPQPGNDAAKAPRPASSKAHPEVAGVKLGVSTVTDVKSAFAKVTPPLRVGKPRNAVLEGVSQARNNKVEVPGSQYVAGIAALSVAHSSKGGIQYEPVVGGFRCGSRDLRVKEKCDETGVHFAPFPSANVAMAVAREVNLVQPVTVEVLEKSLSDQYGAPSARREENIGYGKRTLRWAWSSEGTVLAKLSDPCNNEFAQAAEGAQADPARLHRVGDHANALLDCGVAAIVEVNYNIGNGVADRLSYSGFDVFGYVTSNAKAVKAQDDAVAAFERKEREDAAKVKPPE